MSKNTVEKLTDQMIKALEVLSQHGGKYSAAFIGKHLNPTARMAHCAAASVLRALEARGLAASSLSNTWSSSVYLWSLTPKGRKRLAAIQNVERA